MKNTVIEFIVKNGWIKHEENNEFQSFHKVDNIGIDISDDEIVLINDRGDYLHISIGDLALYTLLGHMFHHRIIASDYRWPDQPEKPQGSKR